MPVDLYWSFRSSLYTATAARAGVRALTKRLLPEQAQALYNYFVETLRRGPVPVETGVFQATMEVHLVNQGPVTILMDTADWNRK